MIPDRKLTSITVTSETPLQPIPKYEKTLLTCSNTFFGSIVAATATDWPIRESKRYSSTNQATSHTSSLLTQRSNYCLTISVIYMMLTSFLQANLLLIVLWRLWAGAVILGCWSTALNRLGQGFLVCVFSCLWLAIVDFSWVRRHTDWPWIPGFDYDHFFNFFILLFLILIWGVCLVFHDLICHYHDESVLCRHLWLVSFHGLSALSDLVPGQSALVRVLWTLFLH